VCTVITLQRPGHAWPLLLAANRDERIDRAWDAPGAYWPDQPDVVAGRDRLGGGTWMGVNAAGVVATILNRSGSLGPADGKRSRGQLPLLALAAPTAGAAAAAVAALDGADYRSFNMVIADRESVWFVRNLGDGAPAALLMTPGLHMVTAHDPDASISPRVVRHRPRFAAAPVPAPPDWAAWEALLADSAGPFDAALAVPPHGGFGTVSASLFGVPDRGRPVWRFARGMAGQATFKTVGLP
jgi:uncharacterized protein with NRDE domain